MTAVILERNQGKNYLFPFCFILSKAFCSLNSLIALAFFQ